MFSASLVVVGVLLLEMNALPALGAIPGEGAMDPFDEETSSYSKAKDTSPIARLQERIDRGEVKLRHDDRYGKDTKGRSLRQFDLATRLFKYPCSYLIYSDGFDALPRQLKDTLYQRLWDILSGKDTGPAFARIPAETKKAIIEILIETKKELPSYWKRKG